MISFNPFNILHVNVTIIYILWISVFFHPQCPDTLAWLVWLA